MPNRDTARNLDDAIRALAAARRLPESHLARWLAMDEQSRSVFLELAGAIRLRTGQIVQALELLGEIAVREGKTSAEILAAPELARISARAGSAPEQARAFIDALRAIRFPRLRQAAERLEREIAALRLPRGISIVLPRELGSDVLTICLEVAREADLERALAVLADRRAAIARIAVMLGGSDEI
ncbi:MAG TPA: hypothetical protein VNF29_08205 [Candidatus Binataceae bacterium]|nr:hypothetical protein [Candidatus Binataceae bacterium]